MTDTCQQCEKWPLEDIGKSPDQNLRPEWPAVPPFQRSIINKDMGFIDIYIIFQHDSCCMSLSPKFIYF